MSGDSTILSQMDPLFMEMAENAGSSNLGYYINAHRYHNKTILMRQMQLKVFGDHSSKLTNKFNKIYN